MQIIKNWRFCLLQSYVAFTSDKPQNESIGDMVITQKQ